MSSHPAEQIKLPRALINQLMRHAQNGDGKEVCGFVASLNGEAVKTYPIGNIATLAEKRFEMEPKAQINALKNMREQGLALFAIYHSHPTSPAAPSQVDIDEFSYPEALSMIISLDTQGVLELRAFRITGAETVEVAIEIK